MTEVITDEVSGPFLLPSPWLAKGEDDVVTLQNKNTGQLFNYDVNHAHPLSLHFKKMLAHTELSL